MSGCLKIELMLTKEDCVQNITAFDSWVIEVSLFYLHHSVSIILSDSRFIQALDYPQEK
jgi:hypothetical protein